FPQTCSCTWWTVCAISSCPIPTVCLGVTSAVVYTYGCNDGRILPTRCAIIDAGLGDRCCPCRACRSALARAGSGHRPLVAGSGLVSTAVPGGSLRSRTTPPAGIRPCGDANLARSALGTHSSPLHPCRV